MDWEIVLPGAVPELTESKKTQPKETGRHCDKTYLTKSMLRLLVPFLVGILCLAWGVAALVIDGPAARVLGPISAGATGGIVVAVLGIIGLWCLRPWTRAFAAVFGLFVVVLLWWLSIEPRNDRQWLPDVERLPRAEIAGDQATIHNVRNFEYRAATPLTEAIVEERWETRTYNLADIKGVDIFLSYWGSPWITHTILSWEFGNGEHLAVSIETRKEVGETYSAFLGFFRQYELYFVVADERDLIKVRANYRGEDVFLYRLKSSPTEARTLLEQYLRKINRLVEHPEWYNAFSQNCTTEIRQLRKAIGQNRPWDWRMLANGYLDQLGYERGMIDTTQPFHVAREQARITERSKATTAEMNFSSAIRGRS